MAVASYTSDLTLINNAETGTWAELTGYTGGGAPAVNDTDYYIQGSGCTTQSTGGKTGLTVGMAHDYGSDLGPSFATGDCMFIWSVFLGGNSIDTWANGGIRLGVGSANGSMNMWKAVGSDYGRNPYGGWQNIAIDPTFTPDYVIGTPTAGVYQWFGSLLNMVAAVGKGNLHAVDALQYGRGAFIVEFGDVTNGYATVAGMAAINDNQTNRWGLMQSGAGSYLWKGLWSLGSVTNAVDFRDSNRTIVVDDTPRTYASFNRIEVNNATSRVDWAGFTLSAPQASPAGTVLAKGEFEAVANATINKDTCVFNDMSTFIYQSNSTIIGSTYRRCGLVTQGGATFTNCLFTGSTSTPAILVNNVTLVTESTFVSTGTGHAMEISTTGTYTWIGNTFSGYGTTGTTDAVIFNNSGGLVTINVSGGDTPTYRNGTNATTVVQVSFTLTLTAIPSGVNVTIVNSSTRTELQHSTSTGADILYSHGGGETVDILLNSLSYDPNLSDVYDLTLPNAHSSIKFQLIADTNYDNPV